MKKQAAVKFQRVDGEIFGYAVILGMVVVIIAIIVMRVSTGIQSGCWY